MSRLLLEDGKILTARASLGFVVAAITAIEVPSLGFLFAVWIAALHIHWQPQLHIKDLLKLSK